MAQRADNSSAKALQLTSTYQSISVYANFSGDADADNGASFEYRRAAWVDTLHRWFDYWLQGVPNGIMSEPRVDIEQSPGNVWKTYSDWPIPGTVNTDVYLNGPAPAEFLDRMFLVWATRTGFPDVISAANGGAGSYKWQRSHLDARLGEAAFTGAWYHYCQAGRTTPLAGPVACAGA